MWHSTFYIRRTRSWKGAKSRFLWKVRATRPPAPARQTRCTTAPGRPPPVRRHVRGVPQGAHLVARPPTGDARAPRLGQPTPVPAALQDQGCPPEGAGPLARAPGRPPATPRRQDPRGRGAGPGDHPHQPLRGSARAPPPPPGARGARRGARLPANTGGHRHYGGPPIAPPPGVTRRPPGAQGPELRPRLGALARRVGRVAHPPPAPVPMDDQRPLPARDDHHRLPPLPSPPPPSAALHGTAHGAPLMR